MFSSNKLDVGGGGFVAPMYGIPSRMAVRSGLAAGREENWEEGKLGLEAARWTKRTLSASFMPFRPSHARSVTLSSMYSKKAYPLDKEGVAASMTKWNDLS